ncbi:MAG: hypothetical protein ACP5PT_02320 [Brevinematia bacterium]
MRKILLILFTLIIQLNLFGNSRKLFYSAEELFYSGEVVKANGIYKTLTTNELNNYELNNFYYKLSFFRSINEAISILSNSQNQEAKSLQNFLIGYTSKTFESIEDRINLGEEKDIYPILEKVNLPNNLDILLCLKLYFSLSNLKDSIIISNTNDFTSLKIKFFNSMILKNLGNDKESKRLEEEIIKNYPNSFWAYLLREKGSIQQNKKEEVELKEGFYIILEDVSNVIRQSLILKKYNITEYNSKTYIGPYSTKSEAENEGRKIASTYRIVVNIVQVK